MKKRKYLFIILIALALFATTFSVIYLSRGSETYKVTTIKSSYNVLSLTTETDEIVIPLYSNNKKCDLVNKDKVANCSICDLGEDNVFKLELNEVYPSGNILQISGEDFYEYNFRFTFKGEFKEELKATIEKAYLKIEMKEKEIKLCIGSLSYYKVLNYNDENNSLDLVCLKAIVNELDEEKSIVGVVIGLKNNSKSDLTINNINLLDINLKAANGEVKIISEVPQSTSDINTLLGYEYNYRELVNNNELSILIDSNETKYLLIPLKRVGEIYTNRFGLEIDYLFRGDEKTYYVDDFLYFKSNQNLKMEDFDIFTYENN